MNLGKRDLIIAIDANAIVHRAFHAYPQTLVTTKGLQVNAVYGFTVMLLEMLKKFDPKYVVCAFDTAAPTFRHKEFSEYKGKRKPVDNSLLVQFPLVEEVLEAFNIPVIKKKGFEADDILGTLANWTANGKWADSGLDMYILTGDRDILQLVNNNVYACLPVGSFSNLKLYDSDSIYENYGYYPNQVVDFKALVGDASDNIPGVKGVGEKTAIELLKKFGTLDGIYTNINMIEKEKVRNLLVEGVEQAEFSKMLATIKRDVDVELQLQSCLLRDYDETVLLDVFKEYEFKSLINKLPKSVNKAIADIEKNQLGMFGQNPEESNEKKPLVQAPDLEELKKLFNRAALHLPGYISKEESISGEDVLFSVIVDNSGQVWFIESDLGIGFTKPRVCETYLWDWEGIVAKLSGKERKIFISSNLNSLDLKLLLYNISSGDKKYSFSSVFFSYISKVFPEKISKTEYNRLGYYLVELIESVKSKISNFCISDYSLKHIDKILKTSKEKNNKLVEIVKGVEMPVAIILSDMERKGILMNYEETANVMQCLKSEIVSCENSIYELIGHEINLNSPKQLSTVIYNELGLELENRVKKSTREDILIGLKDAHPAIEQILRYREISKIQNTYVIPFLKMLEENYKRSGEYALHTDFKQMGSSSGRFASINPNLQNIPVKGRWGDKIRELFVPRDGYTFVGADYSQIEFRVMADISKDPVLIDDFANGKDIHRATASRILGKPFDEISSEERGLGKTVNFAILFGQTPYGLSRLLKISSEIAKKYIDEYFDTYKGVAEYIEKAKESALKYGYVQSMLGRTRYISGLSSRNQNIRSAAIREAVNMPIQGGEADIMKLAMIEIDRCIEKKYKNKAFLLLQIHDEFVFEVKKGLEGKFSDDVKNIMKNIVELEVPLDVHILSADNLALLK